MTAPIPDDVIKRSARAACAEYGDDYDEQPEGLAELRAQWRRGGGDGEVRSHDPGLPTRKDWRDIARAALEASGLAAEVERLTRTVALREDEIAVILANRKEEEDRANAAESRIAELERAASGMAEAGRLAGLEEAAQWHDERAEYFERCQPYTNTDHSVVIEGHRDAAHAIRARARIAELSATPTTQEEQMTAAGGIASGIRALAAEIPK